MTTKFKLLLLGKCRIPGRFGLPLSVTKSKFPWVCRVEELQIQLQWNWVKWSLLLHHPKKSPPSRTQVELKNIMRYFKSVIILLAPLEINLHLWNYFNLFEKQRWSSLLLYSRAKTYMASDMVLASSLMQSLYTFASQVITSLIERQKGTEQLLNQFSHLHCTR